MSEQKNSESYQTAIEALKKSHQIIIDLSTSDLSKIHVDHNWSWVPYLKDHVDFLIEQIGGLIDNLKDSPPPVATKDGV